MLPNFIIPGAQKSGTTALRIYLDQHPNVYMVNKEIRFFNSEENFNKGIKWYEEFFKNSNGKKAIGEKTPEYIYDTKVPERIHNVIPNVKLIFVLRNPVTRAYSHYWHSVRSGVENLKFSEALEKEEERSTKPENKNLFRYKDRGKYINQIRRYSKFFPKSNMFFVLSEDLYENTNEVLSSILEFLNVDKEYEFEDLNKKHVGGEPRNKFLSKLAKNENIKKIRLMRDLIIRINTKKGTKPDMDIETENYLHNYFKPYNNKLAEFTGKDLKKWESAQNKK